MNKIIFNSLLIVFVIFLSGCKEDEVKLTGTVKYINIEGGFYGIAGDDGKNYDPVNLPAEFRKDSLKVEFEYKAVKERISFHMWGNMVEIVSINKRE